MKSWAWRCGLTVSLNFIHDQLTAPAQRTLWPRFKPRCEAWNMRALIPGPEIGESIHASLRCMVGCS